MRHSLPEEVSLEYLPLTTEQDNRDYDNANESADYDSADNYPNQGNKNSSVEENASVGCRSVRISKQSSLGNENERTLVERMNLFHSSKKQDDPCSTSRELCNGNLMTEPFDVSNSHSHCINVMVSELDIHTNTSNKKVLTNQREHTESTLQHTIKRDNKQDALYKSKGYSLLKKGLSVLQNTAMKKQRFNTKTASVMKSISLNNKSRKENKSEEKAKRQALCINRGISDFKRTFTPKTFEGKQAKHAINQVKRQKPFQSNQNIVLLALRNSLQSKASNQIQQNVNFMPKLFKALRLVNSNLINTQIDLSHKKITSKTNNNLTDNKSLGTIKKKRKAQKHLILFSDALLHTIQSINNQKVKHSLLCTISNSKKSTRPINNPVRLNKMGRINLKVSQPTFANERQAKLNQSHQHERLKMAHYTHFTLINQRMHLINPSKRFDLTIKSKADTVKTPIPLLKNIKLNTMIPSIL